MSSLNTSFSVNTRFFFDRPEVVKAVEKANRGNLSRCGAITRKAAQRNIRRRKRPSKPGQGPTNQTGVLRPSLLFSYEPATETVVVGPSTRYGRGDNQAPSLLEGGGRARGGGYYAKRPFMAPALESTQSRYPELWRDSVRGS